MRASRFFFVTIIIVCILSFANFGSVFAESEEVYLGGYPVGISTLGEGLYVDGAGKITTYEGEKSPFADKVKKGDILLKVNGIVVSSREDVAKAIKEGQNELLLINDGVERKVEGDSVFDLNSGEYKLGVFLSTTIDGIGTVSFVRKDGGFCALGHAVTISENASPVPLYDAKAYACKIISVTPSLEGAPGQLNGVTQPKQIGIITKNNAIGAYGKMSVLRSSPLVKVAEKESVKLGKAQIYATIEGEIPDFYEVEIIKTQPTMEKGMTIKVTDERLIKKCGGIVRGMSGSPLLQEGKLIGAVTHVFISEPLKGYAVHAEYLLSQLKDKE